MCTAARADDSIPDDVYSRIPVGDRPHPDYDPIGYRVGSFFITPQLGAGMIYNSNVFASHRNPRADFAALISPQLTVQYGKLPQVYPVEPSKFSAELNIGADIYRFHELTSENRTDAHARLKTHWEVAQDFQVDSKIEVARKHEERGDSGEPRNASEPVPYVDAFAETTLTKTFGRFGVALNGSVRNLTYDDVVTFGGTPLDQSFRDGSIFTTYVRPFYEFSPGYRVFARAAVNTRNYAGTGAQNRDSSGYDVRGGLDFTVTPLIFGSVSVGYMSQHYDNPLIKPVDGLSFKAEATWLATPLLTAKVSAERAIAETVTPGFDARVDTNFESRVDYELLRNVILFAAANYRHEDYRGAMSRTDKVSDLSAGFKYLMNRHLSFGGRYDYVDRQSTQSLFSYDQHVVMLNVTAQY
jgi:hypothetical protein